ncbi:MAG TPA: hypothetical protein VF339_11640 [Gammaproteobacteria bacterium]
MTPPLLCWRCGASLAELSLPLSRRDECPKCRAELHVCRMCVHYAPRLVRGCDEDDAPDVRDKETANFCDYYKPSPQAFDAAQASADAAARAELAKLFGEPAAGAGDADGKPPAEERAPDDPLAAAEALFKR